MAERREKLDREEKKKRKLKERRYGGGVSAGLGGGAAGLVTGAVMGTGAMVGMNGVGGGAPMSPSSASVDMGVMEEQREGSKFVMIDSDQPSKGDTDIGSEGLSTLPTPF